MASLLYLSDPSATPPTLGEPVQYRSAQHWAGETEDFPVVYTDDEEIRAAYEAAGAEVRPLPSGEEVRYEVGEATDNGWYPVIDTETGEQVDGHSARSKRAAQANADQLNAS